MNKKIQPGYIESSETNEAIKTLREVIELWKKLVNNLESDDYSIDRLDHRKLKTYEGGEKLFPCKVIVTYTKEKEKNKIIEKIDINKSFEPLFTMIDWEMRMVYDSDIDYYDITSPLLWINETYYFDKLIITKVYRIKPVSLRQINKQKIYNYSKKYYDMMETKGLNKFNPNFSQSQLDQIFEYFENIKNGNNLFWLHEIVKWIVDKLSLENYKHDYTMWIEYLCYELWICNERTREIITDHKLILKRLQFAQKAFEEFMKQKNERLSWEIWNSLIQ